MSSENVRLKRNLCPLGVFRGDLLHVPSPGLLIAIHLQWLPTRCHVCVPSQPLFCNIVGLQPFSIAIPGALLQCSCLCRAGSVAVAVASLWEVSRSATPTTAQMTTMRPTAWSKVTIPQKKLHQGDLGKKIPQNHRVCCQQSTFRKLSSPR